MLNENSPHQTRGSGSPQAVVIGLDCVTGLQTARILSRRTVPVIGVAADLKHYCCRTNACQKILRADHLSDELIHVLSQYGPELAHRAVLYPCTDLSVQLLSRHRQCLERWYHVDLPAHEIVELLMDKEQFYVYCQKEGFRIPKTLFLRTKEEVEFAAQVLKFPCVLKPPVKTPIWQQSTPFKVYKVNNAEELRALYGECFEWTEVIIVQEWVEGSDADLYTCYGYFAADSEPIATFVARKIRQWPPLVGTSSLGEECRNDTVLAESVRLFNKLRYRGFGYLEFKQDRNTGEYFIIEPNVGRPGVRSAIAEAGGVELLYAKYCYTVGWPLPVSLVQKYGNAKWIYWLWDFEAAFYYWRRGELTLRNWWRSWRGRKVSAVFCWRDPVPFLADLLRIVPKLLKKIRGRRSIQPITL